jgi:hypothetical protein
MPTTKHHIVERKNLIGFFYKALLLVFVLILGCGVANKENPNIERSLTIACLGHCIETDNDVSLYLGRKRRLIFGFPKLHGGQPESKQ